MPDTYTYKPEDTMAAYGALNTEYSNLQQGHIANKKWYRKYRNWAEWWRDTTTSALYGINGTNATDPLAQLQTQLMSQYELTKPSTAFSQDYDFGKMIDARNRALATALRQRAAGMGVQGGYQGAIDSAQAARNTLVSQSLSTYRPMAYQASQQIQNDTDKLVEAMAQADFEGRKSIAGAGRGA